MKPNLKDDIVQSLAKAIEEMGRGSVQLALFHTMYAAVQIRRLDESVIEKLDNNLQRIQEEQRGKT